MQGLKVLWPEALGRMESDVLDISLSGLAVPSTQLLSKVRVGQSFQLLLKIQGLPDVFSLRSRVIRLSAQMVGLVFESVSVEGRLALEQVVKDRLIGQNLRELSSAALHPHLRAPLWVHGPFDSNFFIWFKEDGRIQQALVEYDNLLWSFVSGQVQLEKTSSSGDEAQGYLRPEVLFSDQRVGARVSLGVSWLDRLLKILDGMDPSPSWTVKLGILQNLLRSQRLQ